ncbi:hypothetical protein SDC9_126428 [bioreactor metagenome]|uniref:Uncharacterized protein n=1 Tax=bioreactor metagenome TaxID=1076179 RepID=A0A645CR65_9ZZZZ
MREPQRGKRKHQRIDPDRHGNQHQERRSEHHGRGPHQTGRRAQETTDHTDAQQAVAIAGKDFLALFLARMLRQGVKAHHPVGQPSPYQRRQHQHQGRN